MSHHYPNLSQIPLRISQSVTESPSLKSTDSSQTSTFGVRPVIPASYTVDTDLNSLHSSISTEKNTAGAGSGGGGGCGGASNGGYFLKNNDFSTTFNVSPQCLTNISNNNKEAYSIL